MPNTIITPPRVPLVDPRTNQVDRAWYRWFYNLFTVTGGASGITPIANGGTGLSTTPSNGQLLIGNGTGYALNTLGYGVGISVTNGAGTITVANTGVLSNIAGTGIAVSGATGDVTISNTGVLSWSGGTTGLTPATATSGDVVLAGTLIAANGGTGFASYAVGDLLYADTTTTLAKLPDVATGNALISGGVGVAPAWGKVGLTTHVSGTLPIANGGTNGTATPTAGAVAYGTGTAYGFTAAGTAGQVLTSAGAGIPTWTTPTTGTVTSVGATAPITSSGGTTPTIGVTAAALTKTDDTNVTLTLGGAPTTSLLAATSLTLGWTGTLAASRGGTGLSALGTGVATWLGTPSSANLAAAVTDETGSGALVFGTAPTISNLTVTGTSGNVYSSTWTPTLTAVTNVAASTASEGQFMRVGNVVTFSGQVAIDPTAAGNTALRMTLPVASNLAATRQAAGTFAPAAFADENVGAILADTTNDELLLRYVAKVTTNTTFQFHGTYIVA